MPREKAKNHLGVFERMQKMTDSVRKQIRDELFAMQDVKYQAFQSALCPTVKEGAMIGVRTPQLRAYAKRLAKMQVAEIFLDDLPHQYFEENQLHGFLIAEKKDYKEVIRRLELFLPYVDNWATCDQLNPKVFKKNREDLIGKIKEWISAKDTYTVRFGIVTMMQHFLDEDFQSDYLAWIAGIQREEYYINMAVAWYFATALAKQFDATLPYLQENKLGVWVHNKAIQKARESFRVSEENKSYLKTLKR